MKLVQSLALTLLLFASTLVSTTPAMAASCKGSSQSACSASSSCTWVKGYKKTNGSKVKGYCRVKSGTASKKKKTTTTSKKKKSTSSTKKKKTTAADKKKTTTDKKKKKKKKKQSGS